MLPDIRTDLDRYRVESDWTWEQLSHDMRRHRIIMSPRTLNYICSRAPADYQPRDRTLHKIQLYLQRTKAARERSRKTRGVIDPIAAVEA